jgi:ABC-type protease/lipase transport system fused ATPase/permease subunit
MQSSIETLASFNRLCRYIDLRQQKDKLSLPSLTGRVTVESLSLALTGHAVFHNVSFTLEPGESLGIVGPSSVGKTSLCKVLLGIWPASSGKVRFDGAEISQWQEQELHSQIGYLPQETGLFPGSVADNIARLQQVDPDKVVAAAQKAGIHELILKLPQGYETKIDLTGKNLSAGQRQLISLARALYDEPRFVVLDEPHTHLDEQGLGYVFQTLRNLKEQQVTTVVVTDRSHMLANLDKLLVIRDGQVVLYGPTKEVLTQLANRQQPQQAIA